MSRRLIFLDALPAEHACTACGHAVSHIAWERGACVCWCCERKAADAALLDVASIQDELEQQAKEARLSADPERVADRQRARRKRSTIIHHGPRLTGKADAVERMLRDGSSKYQVNRELGVSYTCINRVIEARSIPVQSRETIPGDPAMVVALIKAGRSAREIQTLAHCDRNRVYRIAAKEGLTFCKRRPGRKVTP